MWLQKLLECRQSVKLDMPVVYFVICSLFIFQCPDLRARLIDRPQEIASLQSVYSHSAPLPVLATSIRCMHWFFQSCVDWGFVTSATEEMYSSLALPHPWPLPPHVSSFCRWKGYSPIPALHFLQNLSTAVLGS